MGAGDPADHPARAARPWRGRSSDPQAGTARMGKERVAWSPLARSSYVFSRHVLRGLVIPRRALNAPKIAAGLKERIRMMNALAMAIAIFALMSSAPYAHAARCNDPTARDVIKCPASATVEPATPASVDAQGKATERKYTYKQIEPARDNAATPATSSRPGHGRRITNIRSNFSGLISPASASSAPARSTAPATATSHSAQRAKSGGSPHCAKGKTSCGHIKMQEHSSFEFHT